VGPVSTRDGLRQTRLVQGTKTSLKVYTVNHHLSVEHDVNARLDTEIDLATGAILFSKDANREGDSPSKPKGWFQAYVPQEEDGCFLETPNGLVVDTSDLTSKVCWWHMADGKVLGFHAGQLVEYDSETLAPLGIVVNEATIGGRQVMVVEEGKAVVLVNNKQDLEVVHPNEDGSYWRKFQRNKKVRMEEKAREAMAKSWLERRRQ
jgi:flagellar motor switch/type III secretory pathway protein FliN